MITEFFDNDLGKIIVIRDRRAKRVTARRKENHVRLTVPFVYSEKKIFAAFTELKPRIVLLKQPEIYYFNTTDDFKTFTFNVKIAVNELRNRYVVLKDKVLNISYPLGTDFRLPETQSEIRKYVEAALRSEAKRIIPLKVKGFADLNGFRYESVKINGSKTRWGSCSSKGNINFSYFLLLLPEYLIDFVVLHELCHTVELNHGEKFWKLLDAVTENNAKRLTKELKSFRTGW